jgi:RimJ/RimL family protein N-acetyltransferase
MKNVNPDHRIQTKRLLIRPFKIEDALDKFKIDSDSLVTQYTGGVKNEAESLKHLEKILSIQNQTMLVPRAVALKSNSELIGWSGLEPFMVNKEKIEIAFGIAQKYWGGGYATEAANAVIKLGFFEYGLDLIVAAVNPQNVASMKVIDKLGFDYCKKIHWPDQGLVNYYELNKSGYIKRDL